MNSDYTRAFWTWSIYGALVAVVLVVSQSVAVGGSSGLLQVGEASPLRPLIEEQLGSVPLTHHVGHDGQIYYAIGLDLNGDDVADYFTDPAYRYRRILFSAISSLFGILQGEQLLAGMILTNVISMAIAAGAVAAVARLAGQSEWLALSVVINPGLWLAVRLLTPEVMATALMALGMMAFLLRRRSMHVAFAASVLTKEAFLLTPLGLGVGRNRRNWLVAGVPLIALGLWSLWGQVTIGGLEGEANNLSIPFTGIVRASEVWPLGGVSEWAYLIFALAVVGSALVLGLLKSGWLRWSLLGWAILGLCSSWFVWRIGNNAARVFAPILVLIVLSRPSTLIERAVPEIPEDASARSGHATPG